MLVSDIVGNKLFNSVVGTELTYEMDGIYQICIVDMQGNTWYERDGTPARVEFNDGDYRLLLDAAHLLYPEMVYSAEKKLTMFFEMSIRNAVNEAKDEASLR